MIFTYVACKFSVVGTISTTATLPVNSSTTSSTIPAVGVFAEMTVNISGGHLINTSWNHATPLKAQIQHA